MPTVKKPYSFYTILNPSQEIMPPIGGQVFWHPSLRYQDILPTADRGRGFCQGDSRLWEIDNEDKHQIHIIVTPICEEMSDKS